MKHALTLLSLLLTLAPGALGGEPAKAQSELAFDDPAGDVLAMSTSSGETPGRDVVRLRVTSDGKSLGIEATLTADVSGTFASDAVKLYLDTDDNPATGGEAFWGKEKGFEQEVELLVCIKYEGGGEACQGGLGGKPTGYYASAAAKDTATSKSARSVFDIERVPIKGKVVAATLPYADIGVKPGQTIRVYARESNGPFDETSFFPAGKLKLK